MRKASTTMFGELHSPVQFSAVEEGWSWQRWKHPSKQGTSLITTFMLLMLLSVLLHPVGALAQAMVWTEAGSITTPRYDHTATLLRSGKVLVAGGINLNSAAQWDLSSVELYDPASNSWSQAAPMATARARHVAVLLNDGRVLVAGGINVSGGLACAEIYDSATNSWSPAGAMSVPHWENFTATVLANGKVLVAGGYGDDPVKQHEYPYPELALKNVDIYDPMTNSWAQGPPLLTARFGHTSSLLPNGNVLVTGGNASKSGWFSSTEIYNPSTNSWSYGASMSTARVVHTAVLLADGNVLVAGGTGESAELYSWATDKWRSAGSMAYARHHFTSTLLPSGKVLVTGGILAGSDSAELYDPTSNQWNPAYSMSAGRAYHTATLLPNQKVLVVQASTELYDTTVDPDNHAPLITGVPDEGAMVASPFRFSPIASDADGDSLVFQITNKPFWADFDTATGTLSGTPPTADYYPGIVISVSDRRGGWVNLPGFHITVNGILVNGACGPANGGRFLAAPSEGLCSTGVPTTVTGSGPWWWRCSGAYGGTSASCQAGSNVTYSIAMSAGPGGILIGDTSQTVPSGGSSSSVRAVPDSGYYFVNWTDSSNKVISTANPLYLQNISANTVLTANFSVKTESSPYSIVFLGSQPSTDGATHYALWGSDGTEAGTTLIKDINTSNGIDTSKAFGFNKVGKWLLFAANDGANGLELWRTDGTAAGTEMIKDLNGLPYSTKTCTLGDLGCAPMMCGGCPGFSCNGDWMCESELSDFPGGSYCDTNSCMSETGSTNFGRFISNGSKAFFMVSTNNWGGFELWVSDATDAGTQKIKEFVYGHYSWTFVGDRLYFGADDGTNNGLWTSDGTTVGTVFVSPLGGNRDSNTYLPFGNKLLLSEPWYTGNVWISDGTSQGTFEIAQQTGPEPYSVLWASTPNYGFVARGSNSNWDLYSTNGTVGNMTKLNSGSHDVGEGMTTVDNMLYFFTQSRGTYVGPSVTDGTVQGTKQIGTVDVGTPYSMGFAKGHQGRVFQWTGDLIWSIDPAQNITSLLTGEYYGTSNWQLRFLADTDKTWFTFLNDGKFRLWTTDGTVAGTIPVKEFEVSENMYLTKVPTIPSNTPAGSIINVEPKDPATGTVPATLTFSGVSQGGTTTVFSVNSGIPPSGFTWGDPGVVYDISTTAQYAGPITVCLSYTGVNFVDPSQLKLFHFENGSWVDRTVSLDTTNKQVCGSVTSLSPFAIFEPKLSATVQQPIDSNGASIFKAGRGVVPIKFTLTSGGAPTCKLPAATISLARTAGSTTGLVNEGSYITPSDIGSSFKISACQYIYNLGTNLLGSGTYRADIKIGSAVVGSAAFGLK